METTHGRHHAYLVTPQTKALSHLHYIFVLIRDMCEQVLLNLLTWISSL